jgi:zinc transport system substrate-binding protein
LKVIAWVIVGLLIVAGAGFFVYSMRRESTEEQRIGVVVTVLPQAEFVEKVMGDRAKITVMVPPGASPHAYEPKPSQLVEVSEAKIYFKVGSGVEFEETQWDKIIAMNPNMRIIDGSKGIEIINNDPHIWNSPINAKKMVQNFYDGLIQVDPEHENEYSMNKDAYLNELDELDEYIKNRFENFTNRVFLIYHPAFGYFAHEYNLTQIPVEHEGKEPTPQVIQQCIENAKEYNLSYVYVAPQFATTFAETIANEIGGETLSIDPLPLSYVANMRSVASSLSLEFENKII